MESDVTVKVPSDLTGGGSLEEYDGTVVIL
jgi:hypothetical protein